MLFQISQCLFALALLGYGITPTLAQMPSYEVVMYAGADFTAESKVVATEECTRFILANTGRLPLGSLKVPSGWTCDLHASDCWTQPLCVLNDDQESLGDANNDCGFAIGRQDGAIWCERATWALPRPYD